MRAEKIFGWIFTAGLVLTGCSQPSTSISGTVIDETGPVSGAVVRVQTTDRFTITDENGEFSLEGLDRNQSVFLTAWASGYYIVGGESPLTPGETGVTFELKSHADTDNSQYNWLSAFVSAGEAGNCQNCHAATSPSETGLPFDEWLLDAHANSATNQRFLTMYSGTDTAGNQSPETRYITSRDYGSVPLPPDSSRPYYGPGYKLDFSGTAGNCAACHAPAAAVDSPYDTDPTSLSGVGEEGSTCDFCHKVWAVRLDPSGLPYRNMPGVLSFELLRPDDGHQFFAGPYDDVAPGEDTYSPLQQQSEFCAPCHYGFFWDTLVYNSFGEWLDSSYSDPQNGQTCQDCHMPTGLTDHFALIAAGGRLREPGAINSHQMLGITNQEFMQNAVEVGIDASRGEGQVSVLVSITNDNTGHHIPTDSPLRQMILIVQVFDAQGQALDQLSGTVIPDWAGIGDPTQGYYAGLPGTGYAKILEELWTEVSPTGAYWNQTRVVSDNRIPANQSVQSGYIFADPGSGVLQVEVRLVYRRAFIDLADQKGWEIPDINIAHIEYELVNPSN